VLITTVTSLPTTSWRGTDYVTITRVLSARLGLLLSPSWKEKRSTGKLTLLVLSSNMSPAALRESSTRSTRVHRSSHQQSLLPLFSSCWETTRNADLLIIVDITSVSGCNNSMSPIQLLPTCKSCFTTFDSLSSSKRRSTAVVPTTGRRQSTKQPFASLPPLGKLTTGTLIAKLCDNVDPTFTVKSLPTKAQT